MMSLGKRVKIQRCRDRHIDYTKFNSLLDMNFRLGHGGRSAWFEDESALKGKQMAILSEILLQSLSEFKKVGITQSG
jgi:hypothetical protein